MPQAQDKDQLLHSKTLVVDNGASAIKYGYAGSKTYSSIPNNIIRSNTERRAFIADEQDQCRNFSGLYYRLAFEKPIFNLPNIAATYDQIVFEEYGFQAYTRMSAPQMCMYNDIPTLFHEKMTQGKKRVDCAVIVDSGYSFTHVVPMWRGKPILVGIRRINVGGKLLTNHLKEIISFRSWNMMDETHLVNQVKEACCYVSNKFWRDLDLCRSNPRKNKILQHYILPDYSTQQSGGLKRRRKPTAAAKKGKGPRSKGKGKGKGKKRTSNDDSDDDDDATTKGGQDDTEMDQVSDRHDGETNTNTNNNDNDNDDNSSDSDLSDDQYEYLPPDEDDQVLVMNNERFTVPEILFHPADVGMEQAGIPEAIVEAISSCDPEIQGMLYANIILVGGNARLSGFRKRVQRELRQQAPTQYEIRIAFEDELVDPVGFAWQGGSRFATLPEFSSEFKNRLVSRAEYLENGSEVCESRFDAGVY
ncbi:Actin- protein 6 [Actinomortierella ambigua]|uniref:Actin-like protein ARP6 n=1 Tax=Actinomortierella ambigua TaxID=1343610 RepID=A0A9P6UCU6_9FUNG|nr:Actin- protein 6 [Actinomortierella ambigua]